MPRYMVLLDGEPCVVGLACREALVEACGLVRLLSSGQPDDAVVTISELVLGEPLLSWRRVGRIWECLEQPVWIENAA